MSPAQDLVQAIDKLHNEYGPMTPLDLIVPSHGDVDLALVVVLRMLDVRVVVQPVLTPGKWVVLPRKMMGPIVDTWRQS